jgi:hypothetical protein
MADAPAPGNVETARANNVARDAFLSSIVLASHNNVNDGIFYRDADGNDHLVSGQNSGISLLDETKYKAECVDLLADGHLSVDPGKLCRFGGFNYRS